MNEATERYIGKSLEELRAGGFRDPDFPAPEDLPVYRAHLAALTQATPHTRSNSAQFTPTARSTGETHDF